MATVIVKNVTNEDIMIEELGINIPALVQIELVGINGIFDLVEVMSSQELKNVVSIEDIVINNGISDLSVTEGLKYITLETLEILRRIYIWIRDGTNANTIKVLTGSRYKGDIIPEEDNLGKGGDTGNFALNADGSELTIKASGITGEVAAVIADGIYENQSWNYLNVNVRVVSGDIKLTFTEDPKGELFNLSWGDNEFIGLNITYLVNF